MRLTSAATSTSIRGRRLVHVFEVNGTRVGVVAVKTSGSPGRSQIRSSAVRNLSSCPTLLRSSATTHAQRDALIATRVPQKYIEIRAGCGDRLPQRGRRPGRTGVRWRIGTRRRRRSRPSRGACIRGSLARRRFRRDHAQVHAGRMARPRARRAVTRSPGARSCAARDGAACRRTVSTRSGSACPAASIRPWCSRWRSTRSAPRTSPAYACRRNILPRSATTSRAEQAQSAQRKVC